MTRTKLILSIASISCLLLSVRAHSQEPGGHSVARAREARVQLLEAEMDVKMHELELVTSEHEVEEATLECEKGKLRVEAKYYTIEYFNHEARRERVGTKIADKDAARQLANKLEAEAEQRRRGSIDARAGVTVRDCDPNRAALE